MLKKINFNSMWSQFGAYWNKIKNFLSDETCSILFG